MSSPREIPWVIEEHTKVKHQLLENYVTVWLAIMFSQQARLGYEKKLIYVDGFAGPGLYWLDGTKCSTIPGSPIIIAKKANEFIEKDNTRQLVIIGVDNEQRCINSLQKLLKETNKYNQHWEATLSTFEETINKIFDYLNDNTHHIAPSFFFIDPFGYSGFCMNTLKRILEHPRTELFINLNVYDINRFIEAEHATNCMHELFGNDEYQRVIQYSGDNKISFLMDLYCKQLKDLSKGLFIQPFRVNATGQGTRPRYFLIHVSQNIKALKEMKNAMSKSATQPFRFEAIGIDPCRQLDLFEPTGEEMLKSKILEFISRSSNNKISYEGIEDWAYQSTSGIAKEIKTALVSLESEKKIIIERKPRQRSNTVNDGAFIQLKNR